MSEINYYNNYYNLSGRYFFLYSKFRDKEAQNKNLENPKNSTQNITKNQVILQFLVPSLKQKIIAYCLKISTDQ